MMGMSSACSNPVLYGWLNENFWKEFKDIMCISGSSAASCNENDNGPPRRKPSRKMAAKTDLLTVAGDQHGATAVTEMSMLTKC